MAAVQTEANVHLFAVCCCYIVVLSGNAVFYLTTEYLGFVFIKKSFLNGTDYGCTGTLQKFVSSALRRATCCITCRCIIHCFNLTLYELVIANVTTQNYHKNVAGIRSKFIVI